MKLITKQILLETLVQRYKKQYASLIKNNRDPRKVETLKELINAEPLTAKTAIEIIGSKAWTNNILSVSGRLRVADNEFGLGEVAEPEAK